MNIDLLLKTFNQHPNKKAIIFNKKTFLYKDIIQQNNKWVNVLKINKIKPGHVVSLISDYSFQSISLIITLIKNRNIIVPIVPSKNKDLLEFYEISHTQFIIKLLKNSYSIIENKAPSPKNNKILFKLIATKSPGLVLFTSGTTGKPKAVLHNFDKLLQKFINADKQHKTLCFLMFDHIAGIDTYFYSLFSGGIAVLPISRSPEYICNLIEQHKIEVLPTSPTFLNILLMSEKYQKYDLKSLKIITFGSEAMPEFLLNQLKIKFKGIKLIQKYGMTEFGSPNSKTNKRDSSWLKLNSDKFKTKIIDDILYIKTGTTMVGYLNSPSPFTHDGWFKTGDTVEVSGDYIKILGRKSEIINVGGEKVYPQEIENVLLKIDNICEALVYGEKNAILGSIVCAKIWLKKKEDHKIIVAKIKKYCSKKIERYKIPVKIKISSKKQYNKNYKKIRTL